MALETGNYFADLNPANPAPGDPKSQGDDHLRLIKLAALQTLLGFTGAILVGGNDVGVSNAYVLTPATGLLAYGANMAVLWFPSATNGGASTMAISGLPPQAIKRLDGSALVNGDIMIGFPTMMVYNGAEFRLLGVTKQYVDQLVFAGVLPGQAGNAGKPLITDGSSATFSSTFGVAMDEAKGLDVAAAATVNLNSGPNTGNLVHITGTTPITAITLPAGAERTLVFDAATILTNSGNLILPGGANITTTAGDSAIVRGEGAGVVRVIDYQRANGRAVVEAVSPGVYLLGTLTPAGSANADALVSFNSTYDSYQIIGQGITMNGTGQSLALFFANSGVVDGASNIYTMVNTASNTAAATASIASAFNGGGGCNIKIDILNANDAVAIKGAFVDSISNTSAGNYQGTSYQLAYKGLAAISGFRLSWNLGALFTGGTIKIYGIKKA